MSHDCFGNTDLVQQRVLQQRLETYLCKLCSQVGVEILIEVRLCPRGRVDGALVEDDHDLQDELVGEEGRLGQNLSQHSILAITIVLGTVTGRGSNLFFQKLDDGAVHALVVERVLGRPVLRWLGGGEQELVQGGG